MYVCVFLCLLIKLFCFFSDHFGLDTNKTTKFTQLIVFSFWVFFLLLLFSLFSFNENDNERMKWSNEEKKNEIIYWLLIFTLAHKIIAELLYINCWCHHALMNQSKCVFFPVFVHVLRLFYISCRANSHSDAAVIAILIALTFHWHIVAMCVPLSIVLLILSSSFFLLLLLFLFLLLFFDVYESISL